MFYHPFRHLGLKALAVAVGLGLWFAVAGEQTVERSLRVPLETQNTPERLELVENPPATVEVRVRGGADLLSHLGQADLVAVLDLGSAKAGRRFFHLTREQVRAPYGVEVVQLAPATIALRFEASATRSIPVLAVVEGEPAAGYVQGSVTVEPPTIEVSGPETALRALREALTEPVSIAGAKQRVHDTVTIGVPDSSLRLRSPGTTQVTVDIKPSPVERSVAQVPVRLRNVGRNLTAEAVPSAITVITRGARDVVDAIQPDALVAFVDLAGLLPGRYNPPVRLEPPQGVIIVRSEPATVRVRIDK
jgi:hypothetical protein